jgi:hypothetical protein
MSATPRESLLDLNDSDLSGKRFERFALDLIMCDPDVRDAHLYGVHGDDQEGIDIHVDLCDGRVRSIQCRRVKRFNKTDATKLVKDTSYPAEEHRLWCTCGMSAGARKVFAAAPGWDGRDIEQLSSDIRRLPRETGRWLVEDHLGAAARRRFLGPDSELCLISAERFFANADRQVASLRTDQILRGRSGLVSDMVSAVSNPQKRVLVLSGRGGLGKTRMLRALSEAMPAERVLLLRDGVEVTATLAEELPEGGYTLLIDDAHRREKLPALLATVLAGDDPPTIVLATRPQRLNGLSVNLFEAGVATQAITILDTMEQLSVAEATALAEEELDEAHAGAADALARTTRDVPALCVLGARLINDGDLNRLELIDSETARMDILHRFSLELRGRVSEEIDPMLVARLLDLAAAHQPLIFESAVIKWLAVQLASDPDTVRRAVGAVEAAGLLVGEGRRRRVAPDILGDHILRAACIGPDGAPTGFADECVANVPDGAATNLLTNLAELDWRLTAKGQQTVLDAVLRNLNDRIVAGDASERRRLLGTLEGAAGFLSSWIIALARRLLDSPAQESEILPGYSDTDAHARRALVPLLHTAGFAHAQTRSAIHLLWEIGRDSQPQPMLAGGQPLALIKWFGSYDLPRVYREALLDAVEELVHTDTGAGGQEVMAIKLLEPLVVREGTTTSSDSRRVSWSSYFVDPQVEDEFRTRVRQLLRRCCVSAPSRTRSAAATLLGDMLREPHGYFGHAVPPAAIAQWRPEQVSLIETIGGVMATSEDPMVSLRLRDSLAWHSRYSHIRGVRTAVRRTLSANPMSTEESLIRALGGSFDLFQTEEGRRRVWRRLAAALVEEANDVDSLLGRIDAALEILVASGADAAPGLFMGFLAERNVEWALEAGRILIGEADRPCASALGVLLTASLASQPDRTRNMLGDIAASPESALRRLAADYVSRVAWLSDPDAPERQLAVAFAADKDPQIVGLAINVAHRAAMPDPDLAIAIILNVPSLQDPGLAEAVCMALHNEVKPDDEQHALLLQRLIACPTVEYWHDQLLITDSASRPRQILDYLLARFRERKDDYTYNPIPYDGLSKDPLAQCPDLRVECLEKILRFTAGHDEYMFDAATLFWSYATADAESFGVIATALVGESAAFSEAAMHLLSDVLDALPAESVDPFVASLRSALLSGDRLGTPGEPFREDAELLSQARSFATAARPAGRAHTFWESMVKAAETAISQSLARDRELEESEG